MDVSRILQVLIGDAELDPMIQRTLSVILLVSAILVAWIPHEGSCPFLIVWSRTVKTEGFAPDLIATIFSIMLVLPLYLRGILKWRPTSVYRILSALIITTLIATSIKIILGDGFSQNLLLYCLIAALALSWLGLRPIAAAAWIAVFVLGASGLIHRNCAMGTYGYVFVISGFLGMLLHFEVGPGDILTAFSDEFSREYKRFH